MNRIKEHVLAVGRIGEEDNHDKPKPITRLLNTKEYYEAVRLTESYMQEAKMTTTVDKIGNLKGVLKGIDPNLKSVAIGSHLDTVRQGGIFDGNLGVQAAVECIYRFKEQGIKLRHDVEIWGFNAEESSGLGGTFGSWASFGLVDMDQPGLEDVLGEYGFSKQDILDSLVDPDKYQSFTELHIEQGGLLEETNSQIGIVTGIVGIYEFKVTSYGQSNHAGTTMMSQRKDALVAMAKLIQKVDDLARAYGDGFVATVGMINVAPGAGNIIPRECEITLEMRHMQNERYERFIEEIKAYAQELAPIEFKFEELSKKDSVPCNSQMMDVIETACKKSEISSFRRMPSGAGHDANTIGNLLPIGMIFVPSKKGISHSRFEDTDWEDIEAGVDVLYHTILELDKLDDISQK